MIRCIAMGAAAYVGYKLSQKEKPQNILSWTDACRYGDVDAIAIHVDSGVDIKTDILCGVIWKDPVQLLFQYEHTNAIAMLMKKGVQIAILRDSGCDDASPLIHACRNRDFDMVKKILNDGVDINKRWNVDSPYTSYPCETALRAACRNGDEELVSLLIEHGAGIEFESSIFYHTCRHGYIDLAVLLVIRFNHIRQSHSYTNITRMNPTAASLILAKVSKYDANVSTLLIEWLCADISGIVTEYAGLV